jgi:hypothetical protein
MSAVSFFVRGWTSVIWSRSRLSCGFTETPCRDNKWLSSLAFKKEKWNAAISEYCYSAPDGPEHHHILDSASPIDMVRRFRVWPARKAESLTIGHSFWNGSKRHQKMYTSTRSLSFIYFVAHILGPYYKLPSSSWNAVLLLGFWVSRPLWASHCSTFVADFPAVRHEDTFLSQRAFILISPGFRMSSQTLIGRNWESFSKGKSVEDLRCCSRNRIRPMSTWSADPHNHIYFFLRSDSIL